MFSEIFGFKKFKQSRMAQSPIVKHWGLSGKTSESLAGKTLVG